MAVNDAVGHAQEDPWLGEERNNETRQAIYEFWNNIPEANRAWLEVAAIVPFEEIMDIDDLGDEYVKAPHVYAPFAHGKHGPFKSHTATVETIGRWDARSFSPHDKSDGRIEYFPADLREPHDDSE